MFKKLLPCMIFALLSCAAYSQTIVSTTPENKKVILEEFTGIHCVWCPAGHALAQGLQNSNPGNVFLINVHTGGFSNPSGNEPDFRTPFGNALRVQSGVNFYPSGTVNRHVFSGGITGMDRGAWVSSANTILAQPSYLNVAVEASIDIQTNELTVHVEGYYTGNSPEPTNLLNIALLQNNTLGPQTGGGAGNQYNHQHRLVHMITGQWGETIATTTTGTLVDETYTYTIPADYNGIATELVDMEIVAFITETHQEIVSGSGVHPEFTGLTNANDASLSIEDINTPCEPMLAPKIKIKNLGQNEITALDIEYSINSGATETYNWTGSISSLYSETIELPAIPYTVETNNTLDVSIPNDDVNSNNVANSSFGGYIESTPSMEMTINTDGNGGQCTWTIKNYLGTTIYTGGPYANNETINRTINFGNDCYLFTVLDSGGDGGNTITLKDSNGDTIYTLSGNYGSEENQKISTFILGLDDNELSGVSIYPNPANTVLNIKNAENSTIQVFNILGQQLYTKTNIALEEQVNVSHLNQGTYFVKITNGTAVKTSKFVVAK